MAKTRSHKMMILETDSDSPSFQFEAYNGGTSILQRGHCVIPIGGTGLNQTALAVRLLPAGSAHHLQARPLGVVHSNTVAINASGTFIWTGRTTSLFVNPGLSGAGGTIASGDFLKLSTTIPGAATLCVTGDIGGRVAFAIADEDRSIADGLGTIRAFVLPWSL